MEFGIAEQAAMTSGVSIRPPSGMRFCGGPIRLRARVHLATPLPDLEEARRVIEAWIDHYNERRPHSRLGYVPPSEWRLRQSQITA